MFHWCLRSSIRIKLKEDKDLVPLVISENPSNRTKISYLFWPK